LVSGSTGSLFSSCIPIIINLKNTTASIPNGTSSIIQEFTTKLHSQIVHYFFGEGFLNLLSPEALIYCLLDPRFKALTFAPKENTEAVRQLLTDLHSKLHQDPPPRPQADQHQGKLYGLYGVNVEPRGTSRKVLESYFQEPPLDLLGNPLNWWKERRGSYPALATVARKLLSRPSTSVPCERLFSEAGNIVNDLRSSLDSDSVAMLLFIEHNIREVKKLGVPFVWD